MINIPRRWQHWIINRVKNPNDVQEIAFEAGIRYAVESETGSLYIAEDIKITEGVEPTWIIRNCDRIKPL